MAEIESTSNSVRSAVDAGVRMAKATEIHDGRKYAFVVPDGGKVHVVDNDDDKYRPRPRRKKGKYTVRDAASFTAYWAKHHWPESELWADANNFALIGVINAHGGAAEDGEWQGGAAGWGDHRVELRLQQTPGWATWRKYNTMLLDQLAFAELLEQRLVDIAEPPGADMLEIAQSFNAQRNVAYESGKRLSSGQVQLAYHEEIDAKAGQRGELTIPEAFTLALQPFEGSDAYKVTARLRWRLKGQELRIGYVLTRPEDVERTAFEDVVATIQEAVEQPIHSGTSA